MDEYTIVITPPQDLQVVITVPDIPVVSVISIPGTPGQKGAPGQDGKGITDFATEAEVKAGLAADKSISPATLTSVLYRKISYPIAASTWNIIHNMGRCPSVTVTDSAGTVVGGDVSYPTVDTVRIDFAFEVSGDAYLS